MLKRMTIGGATVAFLAALISPANAQAADSAPPAERITVDVATVNGSGCPAGTASVTALPDNTAFTVSYSDYLAATGDGSEPTDFRKNCQLSLVVHVPQGFTYAIASADYRGYAYLGQGATGEERANYYFQGDAQNTPVSHTLSGPYNDDWRFTDTTDVAKLAYAPCGETRGLNVNTELRVRSGADKSSSFMTMDSTRGSVNTVYHFSWKRCP